MTKIKNPKNNLEIVEIDSQGGFAFNKGKDDIKITVYDNVVIENIIADFFKQKFQKLVYLVSLFNSSDDDDTDDSLVRDKCEELKQLLIIKYQKFLNKKDLAKYINMIDMLESEIKITRHKGR